MSDEYFQLRRRSFIAFYLLLGAHVCSSFDIVTDKGIEIIATFPICTLYVAFTTFMMLASAYFGRKYHKHVFTWFFLLQYPTIMFVLHLIMRSTGRYIRIYSMSGILSSRDGELRIIFIGRMVLLAVIAVCLIFMVLMLLDAYKYFHNQQRERIIDEKRITMRHNEILNIAIYTVLLIGMMSTYMIPSLVPHIISNILMSAMICRTYYVYNNFLRYSEIHSRRHDIFIHIGKQIEALSEQERNNPIFRSNSNLEDVAAALNVDRQDLSDYLYEELNTTFSAWMSDIKIMHFTKQLTQTDRKISELALACGYANVTSLNRAFKTNFGYAPSEYRERNKH